MSPLNIDQVKAEKANAVLRYEQIRKITFFFRGLIEISLILAMISRISLHIPLALKLSSEYLQNLSIILVSREFVFVLGNAIVIILFVKSSRPTTRKTPTKKGISQQKQKQKQKKKNTSENADMIMGSIFSSTPLDDIEQAKIYQRSKSEKIEKKEKNCCEGELKRWNTERRMIVKGNIGNCCMEAGAKKEIHYPEDHMSSEEFREIIEAFIARQQKFLREEEFSDLGYNNNNNPSASRTPTKAG